MKSTVTLVSFSDDGVIVMESGDDAEKYHQFQVVTTQEALCKITVIQAQDSRLSGRERKGGNIFRLRVKNVVEIHRRLVQSTG